MLRQLACVVMHSSAKSAYRDATDFEVSVTLCRPSCSKRSATESGRFYVAENCRLVELYSRLLEKPSTQCRILRVN
jgi:hypothetical protein